MKTLCTSVCLSLLAFSGFAQTEVLQTETEADTQKTERLARNNIYISPFNLIVNQFLVGYERDFGKSRHSILFQAGAMLSGRNDGYYYGSYPNNYNGTDWGITAEVQYRYRIVSVTNPRGKAKNPFRFDFYAAPFAAYQHLNYYAETSTYDETTGVFTYDGYEEESQAISGGIVFGTRFTFFERFTLDTYAGGGLKFSPNEGQGGYSYSYNYDIFRPNYSGVIGKVNLQVGVAF